MLKHGDKLKIDNDISIQILWPLEQQIKENILNNNSIVAKLIYKDTSILFTGDIEEIAEKKVLQEYRNNIDVLKADILKVGHHGSKTSSIQEFLNAVKPKVALIGVGEKNTFGHPNKNVIARLERLAELEFIGQIKWER